MKIICTNIKWKLHSNNIPETVKILGVPDDVIISDDKVLEKDSIANHLAKEYNNIVKSFDYQLIEYTTIVYDTTGTPTPTEISIDNNHTIFINQNGHTITLSKEGVNVVERLSNKLYYKEDVAGYFEERELIYDIEKLSKDVTLLDDILNAYTANRENADFGDAAMSWTECLQNAVNQFEKELSKYKI